MNETLAEEEFDRILKGPTLILDPIALKPAPVPVPGGDQPSTTATALQTNQKSAAFACKTGSLAAGMLASIAFIYLIFFK